VDLLGLGILALIIGAGSNTSYSRLGNNGSIAPVNMSDPTTAAILRMAPGPGVFGMMRDNIVKRQLYEREMDVLKQEKLEQGSARDAVDWVSGLLPLKDFFARTGNVAGVRTSFWDSPSTIENRGRP